MKHKAFWIAFGVGALVGGVAVLLLAPQSGERTRKDIGRGLSDLGGKLDEAGDYLKAQAEQLGKQAQKLLDAGKEQIATAIDGTSEFLGKASKTADAVQRLM